MLPKGRLAPDSRWPSGPQDVAAVVHWLAEHASRSGGDAQRIVLMGESAGAAHVASAVPMCRFGVEVQAGVRGAILASGPCHAWLERLARSAFGVDTPDPRNDAHFGTDDATELASASIVEQIDAPPMPLPISVAERDLLQTQMQVQAGEPLVCTPGHALAQRTGLAWPGKTGAARTSSSASRARPPAAFWNTCCNCSGCRRMGTWRSRAPRA